MREHVDLPTVEALRREWHRHPPVHHLVAAYLDYKPRDERSTDAAADVGPLLAAMGDIPIRQVMPIDTSAWDNRHNKGPSDG